MTRITDFEIVDHGIDHSDYFQGCGVAYTSYNHVVTGIGDNPAEAYDDACEMLAQSGHSLPIEAWDEFDRQVMADIGRSAWPTTPSVSGMREEESDWEEENDDTDTDNNCYYHLSIRYNLSTDTE